MVEEQIARRGVRDPRVLAAVGKVPRHLFVPAGLEARAYDDKPLGIGREQTISQPYMVALMSEALELRGGERVLEVGTGSGYQTAVLLELGADVLSVERVPELSAKARAALDAAGYGRRGRLTVGDGSSGVGTEAPFDRIIVTAGAPAVPPSLVEQLGDGGVMVIPVGGEDEQDLLRLRREDGRVTREKMCGCVFVKLLGAEGW
ncbi:MAG TPA: protein-L-isoaspartate(D-aspartate) O-methyltransferase [Planctomycetota bacterium]